MDVPQDIKFWKKKRIISSGDKNRLSNNIQCCDTYLDPSPMNCPYYRLNCGILQNVGVLPLSLPQQQHGCPFVSLASILPMHVGLLWSQPKTRWRSWSFVFQSTVSRNVMRETTPLFLIKKPLSFVFIQIKLHN